MRSRPYCENIGNYMKEPYKSVCDVMNKTGLRVSDALRLTVEDIKKRQPYIHEKKTGKTRRIFISRKLQLQMLKIAERKNLTDKDFIFAAKPGGKPPARQTVYRHYKKAAQAAGIDTKGISPHSSRKNYVKAKSESGMTVEQIRKKVGHDNLSTTLLYLYADQIGGKKKNE